MFKIFKIIWQIKKGTFNAKEFAGEEGADMATGVLWIPIIILGVLALFLLVTGFTTFWFGPVTFLGILGLLTLLPIFILLKIKNKITKAIQNQVNRTTI